MLKSGTLIGQYKVLKAFKIKAILKCTRIAHIAYEKTTTICGCFEAVHSKPSYLSDPDFACHDLASSVLQIK